MVLRRRLSSLAACMALIGPATAGCDEEGGPRELTVDELTTMMDESEVAIFDANGVKVRQEYGVIPGAKLLESASGYDPARWLPEDAATTCVFYCSSTWCSAARTAAKRAMSAGHREVAVLPVGIKGWKAAGRPTERP